MRGRGTSLLLLVCLLAVGCGRKGPSRPEDRPPLVRVAEPVEKTITDYEYFTGRTDAVDTVDVRARVTGYLIAVDFKAGQEVKGPKPDDPRSRGQRLFKIDPRPYQAALDNAKGQLALNQARLELAKADYERSVYIRRQDPNALSQQDLDKYKAAQAEADAAVKAAKASVEAAQLNLDFTDINAPVDGIVGRNLLTVGNLVTQDQTLLTTVVSEDPMYVYFDVDERTLLRVRDLIREGKIKVPDARIPVPSKDPNVEPFPVDIGLANDRDEYPHQGVIDFVNNQLNASTGTLQVRGVFANPKPERKGAPRLLTPGMFVRVRIPVGKEHNALLIPEAAIGTDQDEKYIMVVVVGS